MTMNLKQKLPTRWLRPIDNLLNRLQQRFRKSRAGSVLIMVVALLVLLALMGTAYVATARLDRQGSAPLTLNTTLDDTLNQMVQGVTENVKSRLVNDHELTTSATAYVDTQRVLASRTPGLVPMYIPHGTTAFPAGFDGNYNWPTAKFPASLTAAPIGVAPVPNGRTIAWTRISRPEVSVKFDSPYNPLYNYTSNPNPAPLQWDGDSLSYFFAPTNIAITYPQNGGANLPVSDGLEQRTRVFPAFYEYAYSYNPGTNKVGLIIGGPYMAGDAAGTGVADTGLVQINSTPIDGLTFYYGMRVIDNSSAFNANIHFSPTSDNSPIAGVGPQCFFPGSVDLKNMMAVPVKFSEIDNTQPPGQYSSVVKEWNHDTGTTPATAGTGPRAERTKNTAYNRPDMAFTTAAEAYWSQYGSRLNWPSFQHNGTRFGLNQPTAARSFGTEDDQALAYRGGVFVNPDAIRSHLEDTFFHATNQIGTSPSPANADSLYTLATNYVSTTSDQFRFVTARDVSYWYDVNYNWEGIIDSHWLSQLPAAFFNKTSGAAANFTYARSTANKVLAGTGLPFRTPRPLLVASNPVSNRADANLNVLTATYNAYGSIDPTKTGLPYSTMTRYITAGYTPKVSLNTAQFGDLWRGFFLTMIDSTSATPTLGGSGFNVPGIADTANATQNVGTFRNSIRGNDSGNTGGNSNAWKVKFDRYQQLLLRSAIAAVNTIDIRDSDGLSGQNKIGNVTSKKIQLKTTDGKQVEVTVFGTEAHPLITEVYVNTDTVTADGAGQVNPKGFIAVELFNPYPFPLKLSQYKLAVLDRRLAPTGTMKLDEITVANADLAALTIPAGDFVVLHNFQNGGTDAATYFPKSVNKGDTTTVLPKFHHVKGLTQAIEGGATPGTGGELFLMRAHHGVVNPAPPQKAVDASWDEKNIDDWVPVDSFDFTGLSLVDNTKAYDWHYSRIVNTTAADAWKCVYPGKYQFVAGSPRLVDTQVAGPWDPNMTQPDPWDSAGDPKTKGHFFGKVKGSADATVTNLFPGIQLNNFNWGTKVTANAAQSNKFPFGGFARVGDILQVPYIGGYRIRLLNAASGDALVDLTSVTMDSSFIDDEDTADDAIEQLGRFCPIRLGLKQIDDLDSNGAYDPTLLPAPPAGQHYSKWRYRWASKIFDQFTVIANPHDDYLPNIDPGSDPAYGVAVANFKYPRNAGTQPPTPQANTAAAWTGGTPNGGREDAGAVEGLININTAPWRVIAAMKMIPTAHSGDAKFNATPPAWDPNNPVALTYNEMLAKFIVYYRDVDDGTGFSSASGAPIPVPHPHGPFKNLAELNAVFDPFSWNIAKQQYDRTFQNALGLLTTTGTVNATWGNFASNSTGTANHMANGDFETNFLMVNRISNLVTTRSDTFTAYVVVQGWKNINTKYPELVVQKRAAFLLDRSSASPTGTNYKSHIVEVR